MKLRLTSLAFSGLILFSAMTMPMRSHAFALVYSFSSDETRAKWFRGVGPMFAWLGVIWGLQFSLMNTAIGGTAGGWIGIALNEDGVSNKQISLVEAMSLRFQQYGANPYEAEELAILLVNSLQKPNGEGESVVTDTEVQSTAPLFFKSEGFKKFQADVAKL